MHLLHAGMAIVGGLVDSQDVLLADKWQISDMLAAAEL